LFSDRSCKRSVSCQDGSQETQLTFDHRPAQGTCTVASQCEFACVGPSWTTVSFQINTKDFKRIVGDLLELEIVEGDVDMEPETHSSSKEIPRTSEKALLHVS
jgi:hypothetical protein